MRIETLFVPLASILLACGISCFANAQDEPAGEPAARGLSQLDEYPPQIALGLRALGLETVFEVRPTVVIVPDTASYVEQVRRWKVKERWPILIDDGSWFARENIARFVRSFAPERVVRWSAGEDASLPAREGDLRDAIEGAAREAWDAESDEALDRLWERAGFVPPGVAVANEEDGAWTAALALAAGRGLELVWTTGRERNIGAVLSEEALDRLDSEIRTGMERTGRTWRAVGDDLDAIALCRNISTRLDLPEKQGHLALTDRVGRFVDGTRYAWCGMIFGDEQQALYMAMCSLFLEPDRAWLFDGYEAGFAEPFALGAAADFLRERGMDVVADLPPDSGDSEWRYRAWGGLNADLVIVNSKGHSDWFDVAPGRLFGSDVPLLLEPAAVVFIHSFSAQWLNNEQSIARRWFDSGAYAYVGSVHEPFLGAFQPGEALVRRLLASRGPWAAAARIDGAPAWKINVFGDPLLTLGPPMERSDEPLELEGSTPVGERMREHLSAGGYAAALGELVILGRDEDVVRFVRAVRDDDERKLTPEIARAAIFSAFREEEHELYGHLYARLTAPSALHRDLLWQSARALLAQRGASEVPEQMVGLLRASIRDESAAEDASFLAPLMSRLYGSEAVERMYEDLIASVQDRQQIKQLREGANRYR